MREFTCFDDHNNDGWGNPSEWGWGYELSPRSDEEEIEEPIEEDFEPHTENNF